MCICIYMYIGYMFICLHKHTSVYLYNATPDEVVDLLRASLLRVLESNFPGDYIYIYIYMYIYIEREREMSISLSLSLSLSLHIYIYTHI